MLEWKITPDDILEAERLRTAESVVPLTKENVFRAAIYCILAISERAEKHKAVYNTLMSALLDTPDRINRDAVRLEHHLHSIRFNNNKPAWIRNLARNWDASDIPDTIVTGGDAQYAKTLRERMVDEWRGFQRKTASFLLVKCGYETLIPVDIWMLRYLGLNGFDVKQLNYRDKSDLTKRQYLEAENIMTDLAEQQGMTPGFFQYLVWAKRTKWSGEKTLFD